VAQGVLIELHKFWLCHDDLMCCVGGTSRKYAFNKLALPSLWLVQKRTNYIQIKVVVLEEVGFLFSEKPRCPFVNLVGDDIFAFVNHPFECAPWNLFGDDTFSIVYKPLDPNALAKIKEWEEDSSSRHFQTIHYVRKQGGCGTNF
jgi:hypothetical protein